MENLFNWLNFTDGDVIGLIFSSAAYLTVNHLCNDFERYTYEVMNLPELRVGASEIAGNATAQSAGLIGFFTGRVEPVDELIKATLCPDGATNINVTGVVSESSSWELIKSLNVAVAFFKDYDEILLSSTRTAVPFNIVDEGNSIMITNPVDLEDIPLQTVAEKIQLESMSLWRSLLAWSRGYFVFGTKYLEKMLIPGMEVSCLGKLVVRNGVSCLEKDDSFPYTMGIQTKRETIQNMTEDRIMGRIIQYAFCMLAAYYIYRLLTRKHSAEAIIGNKHHEFKYALRTTCAKNATNDTDEESLTNEVKCGICSRLANTLLFPCSHLFLCIFCAEKVVKCDICRRKVKRPFPVMYCT